MKHVNFIPTLSPVQQYEIRRWFLCSLILIIITSGAISFFLIPQLYSLYCLKKDIAVLEKKTIHHANLITKKDTLKKENETIQKKRTKVSRYTNQLSNPHSYLAALITALSTDIKLEHIRKNKKNLELTVLAPSPEHTTQLINKLLETNLFVTLKLTSLQQDTQTKKLRCTIKGKTNA